MHGAVSCGTAFRGVVCLAQKTNSPQKFGISLPQVSFHVCITENQGNSPERSVVFVWDGVGCEAQTAGWMFGLWWEEARDGRKVKGWVGVDIEKGRRGGGKNDGVVRRWIGGFFIFGFWVFVA